MKTFRLDWIDRMRGILIILVVLGHAVGSAEHFTQGYVQACMHFAFKVIYLFHMPAFFFLAGLLAHDVALKVAMARKSKRLLVPYFVFGAISALLFVGVSIFFSSQGMTDAYYARDYAAVPWWHSWASLLYGAPFPGTDGFRCNGVLWFLPCLFVCSFALLGLLKVNRRSIMFLIALCLVPSYVFLARWGCPSLPWGIRLLPKYLPFMIVGYMIGIKADRWLGKCSLLSVVYILLCFIVPYDGYVAFSYWKWALLMGMGLLGTLACCGVAIKIKSRCLSRFGEMSMGIMLMHKWVMMGFVRLGVHNALVVCIGTLAIAYMSTVLIRKYAPVLIGEHT